MELRQETKRNQYGTNAELGQETKRNKKHDKVKYSNNYFVKDHTGFYVLKHKMKLKPKAKLRKIKSSL